MVKTHQSFQGIDFHSEFDIFLLRLDCSKSNLSKDQLQPSSYLNMPQSFGTAMGFSLPDMLSVAALPGPAQNPSHLHTSEDSVVYLAPTADTNRCWPIRPTLRNELDTFSVHFYVFFGPNISIPPDRAAVFAINLMPVLDSGGVLNMELKLNMVSGFYDSDVVLWLSRSMVSTCWFDASHQQPACCDVSLGEILNPELPLMSSVLCECV